MDSVPEKLLDIGSRLGADFLKFGPAFSNDDPFLRIALDVDRAVYPRLFRIGLIPPLCDDGRDVRDLFTRRCEDLFADHLRDDGAHRLIRELIFTKDRLAFGKMFDDLYK